jgi:hypothetical protein
VPWSDGREATVAQDLRCCRTAGCEIPNSAWTTAVIARGQLAIGERLEDPPSDRVAEDIERAMPSV